VQSLPSQSTARFNWQKTQELIRHDSYMVSASFDPAWIDPFAKNRIPQGKEAIESEAVAQPVENPEANAAAMLAALQPQDLGIALGGVVISPRGRLATINGEPCREG